MPDQAKKYDAYKVANSEYIVRKRELLKVPEELCHKLAEDLNIYELRREVEVGLNKAINKAWRLYRRIYDGSPTENDIALFLDLADLIMGFEDFISADMMKVWKVSRDLIWAYKIAFKGTQDEMDQTSIEGL